MLENYGNCVPELKKKADQKLSWIQNDSIFFVYVWLLPPVSNRQKYHFDSLLSSFETASIEIRQTI